MAESEAASSSRLRRRTRIDGAEGAPGTALQKIVFVCYGPFDSNSAGHVAGFANTLAGMGYSVGVAAAGDIREAHAFGPPAFEFFTIDDLTRDPEAVIGSGSTLRPARTVLVCWTPREIVRRAVEPIVARYGIPYVVHLEDNEQHLANLKLGEQRRWPGRKKSIPETIADPARLKAFLAGARGLTLIEERLRELIPPQVPAIVLAPGVDLETFGSELPQNRRATIRRAVGCSPETTMLVYPGNVHRANAEEVAALYEAVALLRGRGHDLTLVRTGTDTTGGAALLKKTRAGHGILALGRVERPFLIDLLKSADLFVQPGKPGPFNDYRLPSKLPEFMAVGRPIVLPATNVGARLRHGVDAMLLSDGSAEEIARQVEAILADQALAARLSASAKAFAAAHYRPEKQARKLESFLRGVV